MKALKLIFIFFTVLVYGQEVKPMLEINYLQRDELLKVKFVYPKEIKISPILEYDTQEINEHTGYFFLLNITNNKNETVKQDFMIRNYTPIEGRGINFKKEIISCDYRVIAKQENLFYFKIVNNENRHALMDKDVNIDSYENEKYLSFFNFKKGEIYQMKLMLYYKDSLIQTSNKIKFIY